MTADPVRATFWAQVEATWTTWYTPAVLRSVHVRKVTQRRPKFPEPGTVLVKLTISLPRLAFVPPVLEGRADVLDGQYEAVPPASVEAEPL
jgi:hypothetical protein